MNSELLNSISLNQGLEKVEPLGSRLHRTLTLLKSPSSRSTKDQFTTEYNLLKGNFLRKMSNEELSSGIDVENNELDQLLEEIHACATEYERRILEVNEADLSGKNEEERKK